MISLMLVGKMMEIQESGSGSECECDTNTFRFTRILRWDQFKSILMRRDQNALSVAR